MGAGEEIHECEDPGSHLWGKVSRQRGATAPGRPSKSTREDLDRVAILALVFADTLRREASRDYGHVHKHLVPMYALVYWADTGEVYASLPLWRFGDQEEERYEVTMPKASHIVGRKGHVYVRIFQTLRRRRRFSGTRTHRR